MFETVEIVFNIIIIMIEFTETCCGGRGGLVISALDSGSRGPGSSPGRVIVLCS